MRPSGILKYCASQQRRLLLHSLNDASNVLVSSLSTAKDQCEMLTGRQKIGTLTQARKYSDHRIAVYNLTMLETRLKHRADENFHFDWLAHDLPLEQLAHVIGRQQEPSLASYLL